MRGALKIKSPGSTGRGGGVTGKHDAQSGLGSLMVAAPVACNDERMAGVRLGRGQLLSASGAARRDWLRSMATVLPPAVMAVETGPAA
jgi:hypothetical protein